LRHSRSAGRPIVHELDDQLLQGLDRALHPVDRATMMALTMLVPMLAFVRKWRAKRELPTAG
jgi:hypothetical protein